MKKTLPIILVMILCFSLLLGCKFQPEEREEYSADTVVVIYPLPETIDTNNLDNCTVAAAFEKGDAYVNDLGETVMDLTVYTYEAYDMVDIASLKENDIIVRQNKKVLIEEIEQLDTGLVRINGGEEKGGFTLTSNDSTIYYEVGMSDRKGYYESGKVSLPVSDEFVYFDESVLGSEPKLFYAEDFLKDNEGLEYNFTPYNTSVTVENGIVVKMVRSFTP